MTIRDAAFQYAFSRFFIYNILWEDTEVDEKFLGIDETSSVLGISGAGCGLAAMLAKNPRSIDAVDINAHHLALTALKISAARNAPNFTAFYDLLGRGWSSNPREAVADLSRELPEPIRRYWLKNFRIFERSALHEGMTAHFIAQLRRLTGINGRFLLELDGLEENERANKIEQWIGPIVRRADVNFILNSPLNLMSLGINFTQRDRICATEGQSMAEFLLAHLKRVAATNLRTNWFAWYAVAGHFNHEEEQALPPYLRKNNFVRARSATTAVSYQNKNLFDVLASRPSNTWSHYTLCDMPDWLPREAQKQLLKEIFRTSRDGAIVLYRTVEDDCLMERHQVLKRFRPLRSISEEASAQDRSRQYRHVHFYQVTH
jgi:S-adenosylmethionine-diacylglycerol 3-amino-3-carboxypropyl transferase